MRRLLFLKTVLTKKKGIQPLTINVSLTLSFRRYELVKI